MQCTWNYLNDENVEEEIMALIKKIHQFNTISKALSKKRGSETEKGEKNKIKLNK